MGYIFLGIPLTIFVLFILPIWLWLHYNNQKGEGRSVNPTEMQQLSALVDAASKCRNAFKTLNILDAEHPNWRQS
ncbi:envelope stress response membrane protein PspB [Enterobacter hormaechei]